MLESIFGGGSDMPSQEAMAQAKLPLGYRDNCAHLLIPLNKVRPPSNSRVIASYCTGSHICSAVPQLFHYRTNARTNDTVMRNVNTKSELTTRPYKAERIDEVVSKSVWRNLTPRRHRWLSFSSHLFQLSKGMTLHLSFLPCIPASPVTSVFQSQNGLQICKYLYI